MKVPRALEGDPITIHLDRHRRARAARSPADYVGADASVAVGAGEGANALVGGFDRSFTLQPLSVEVQSGVALAAGVASLSLRTAP